MISTNPIEKLVLDFDNLPNANEMYTGDPSKQISEEYPTKFVFAYNPDYGIDENITYARVVAENPGAKQYLGFPYGILAEINTNEYKWGIYINEIISRLIKAFEASKNAADLTNRRSIDNNKKLVQNFKAITKDFTELSSQSLEGDTARNRLQLNRTKYHNKLISKSPNSRSFESTKSAEWRLNQFSFPISQPDGSILKNSVIFDRHIKLNTISDNKLAYPYVRISNPGDVVFNAINFNSEFYPIKAKESDDLEHTTINSLLKEVSPDRRYKVYADEPLSISYNNAIYDINTHNYIELNKDLQLEDMNTTILCIIGNEFNILSDTEKTLECNDKIVISNSTINGAFIHKSGKVEFNKVNCTQAQTIESNNVKLIDCTTSDLTIRVDNVYESSIELVNLNSAATKLYIKIPDETQKNNLLTISGKYDIINIIILDKDDNEIYNGNLDNIKIIDYLHSLYKNISVGI